MKRVRKKGHKGIEDVFSVFSPPSKTVIYFKYPVLIKKAVIYNMDNSGALLTVDDNYINLAHY